MSNKTKRSELTPTSGSEDAYSTLQKNYNELLGEHARAIIAVDQLRVAKYLARPRAFQDKSIGTPIQTQTDDPEFSPELEAAVTELESQVTECVPLFTANQDPIGDLQILLGDLQSSLAECLRNSDEVSNTLKDRITDCEDKIRHMEGALSLKIIEQQSSRGNSRASRPVSRQAPSLCHTESLLSGAQSSHRSFDNYHNFGSPYGTADFERDEELCGGDSLSDIIDMHNDLRAESEVVTDVAESENGGQYVPRRRSSFNSDQDSVAKEGQKHNSDSALGSSVLVSRKGKDKLPPRRGSVNPSESNLSVASSTRKMMYCTPIVGGSQAGSRASTPAKGYDYRPTSSYQNSECGSEVQDILSRDDHPQDRGTGPERGLTRSNAGLTRSTEEEIRKRAPIRAKRTRGPLREDGTMAPTLGGYDSGYNEEGSRKSSPNRPGTSGSPKSSPRSAQDFRSEISMVRDDVQELADRLRNLRSSLNSSRSSSPVLPRRSSSPVLPQRSSSTRDALRDRLRRLQCSSPANYENTPRRSASPEHHHRGTGSSSPRLNRSSSPVYYRTSSPSRPPNVPPKSPLLGFPRSPRSSSPYRRSLSPDNRNCQDTRHLFYDRPPENGYPAKAPIEVGVRIGGPSSNFEVGPSQSPARPAYPIDNYQYHVSPTSGLETHFHFNFYNGNNGEYRSR